MYTDHEEILARSIGLNHRWNFKEIRKMKKPITGQSVQKVLLRRNVKPEDTKGANIIEGESNEYFTQYDNGLMVKELGEYDENPYLNRKR